ncbi:MAG: hypothetical protein JEY94_13295 [Melioribacteraceae bacterium]|nr:hypothetical protein [Melioribacteraceae bacterium]
MFLKIKVINILAVVFIVLLFANITIETLNDDEFIMKSFYPTQVKIEMKFNSALNEWGINEEWILTKSLKHPLDSLYYSYEVKIPLTVPIPFILSSVTEKFLNDETKIICKEKTINGITYLNIYADEIEKLRAEFKYDKNILRESKEAAFLITGFNDLDKPAKEKLLKGIEPFAAIIVPDKGSLIFCNQLNEHNKEYAVLLNDDIEYSRYSLNTDKNGVALKKAVKMLSKDFSKAAVFIIDKNSSVYKSAAFNFIMAEFSKYNKTLYSIERFISLPNRELLEVESLFKFHFENQEISRKVFYLDCSTFNNLIPLFNKLRKQGHRFVLPGSYYN